ncbi:MAG: hypothetical protein IJL99_00975 [Firmicutes bacterium]|nr:hypothetical protein [Bacillota bacterium]
MVEHTGLIELNLPSLVMGAIDIIIVIAIVVFVCRFVSKTRKSISDLQKRVEELEANQNNKSPYKM